MGLEHISRRGVLRSTALGGLAAGGLAAVTLGRTDAASADTLHPAVGVWENLAPRLDLPNQAFHNQFAFLFGGIAIFASPPLDSEPYEDTEYTGPFFGVWEADGPTSIAFSVRHATYSSDVVVTGLKTCGAPPLSRQMAIAWKSIGHLPKPTPLDARSTATREQRLLSANECGETLSTAPQN